LMDKILSYNKEDLEATWEVFQWPRSKVPTVTNLVAPDERRDKVEQELLRPTFSLREKPLARICGFLPFSVLCEKLAGIKKLGLSGSLKLNFLRITAEFFPEGDDAAKE